MFGGLKPPNPAVWRAGLVLVLLAPNPRAGNFLCGGGGGGLKESATPGCCALGGGDVYGGGGGIVGV